MHCINDYFGVSQNPIIIKAAQDAFWENSSGSGKTRDIGGANNAFVKLKKKIALFCQIEAALVFTSGNVANATTCASLVKIMINFVFSSEEAKHARTIAGIQDSKAEKHI